MSGQGAYIQLIARDIQDNMTTIQPQMSYFKSVYRAHTNFAREVHEMSIYGDADYGKFFSVRVDRYGDLLGDTYIRLRTTHLNDQGTSIVAQGGSFLFSPSPPLLPTLSIPANSLTIGTSDFTIEFWAYITAIPSIPSADGVLFLTGTDISNFFGLSIQNTGSGTVKNRLFYPGGFTDLGTAISTISIYNAWIHFALVRNGTDLRFFRNGILIASVAGFNYNINQSATVFSIGNSPTPSSTGWIEGNITNFRIVVGSAIYWYNPFTPPLNPLTAISGTQLLLLAYTSNTLLTDSSGLNTVFGSLVSWSPLTPLDTITVPNILPRFGLQLLDYIEIKIGETIIDRHYGRWMDIWSQLVMPDAQYRVWDNMISGRYWQNTTTPGTGNSIIYIPLLFWYTHNPGLFLPLIGLQYHEVFFNIKFKDRSQIVASGSPFLADAIVPDILDVAVLGNYYLLDTYERREFSLMPKLEYLIFSTQNIGTTSIAAGDYNIDITPFFHPIIDLVITAKDATTIPFDYHSSSSSGDGTDTLQSILLQCNGIDRFKRRESTYFRCVQPYQHFPNAIGKQNQLDTSIPYIIDYPKGGFYVYSFALNPEKWWQPSGSSNFSSYDTVTLDIKTRDIPLIELDVWARNYNVLLITGGMGGLVYADKFY